jgi:hypothetical protein
LPWLALSLLFGYAAAAQNAPVAGGPVRNRIGLSYRAGFNISAEFSHAPVAAGVNNPGPASGGANHNYDNGYNRVDITGNNHGGEPGTWYWGYQDASQVPGDGFIYFSSLDSFAGSTSDRASCNPQNGFELTFNRWLGDLGRCAWGVEAAFSFTKLSIQSDFGGTGQLTIDRYGLSGVVPPQPPYAGTFAGPVPGSPVAPVIGDVPTRTVTDAAIRFSQGVEGELYGWRLGPYLDVPLAPRLSVSFSGGLALALIHSDFEFADQASTAAGTMLSSSSGFDSQDELLVGGYLAANVTYTMRRSLDLFVGVQYQNVGSFSQEAAGNRLKLDLSESIFLVAGIRLGF